MGKQTLDKTGQPTLGPKKCPHGVFEDDRGNNACEQCFDLFATENYQLGTIAGFQHAANLIRKKAGDSFADGLDESATRYRALADELQAIVDQKEAEHKKHLAEAGRKE